MPNSFLSAGLHERFSLARAQAGFPATLTVVAKVKSDHLCSRLKTRIDALLQTFPLLSAIVVDVDTSQPGFYRQSRHLTHEAVLQARRNLPQDILSLREDDDDDEEGDDKVAARLLLYELLECGEKKRALSFTNGPLWRIVLYNHPNERYSWLTLSADHSITDGKGVVTLFQMLLAKDFQRLLPSTPLKDIAPASDIAFHASPSILRLASEIWQSLLLPRFPTWIQTRVQAVKPWPSNVPTSQTPALNKAQLDLVVLDRHTLAELKLTALARNIKTVTPLIHSAAYLAVYSMIDSKEMIKSITPISVRDRLGPEATTCTGNFASTADWSNKASSLSVKQMFWSLTRDYAAVLSDPNVAQKGLDGLAVLNYLPNEKKDPPPQRKPVNDAREIGLSQENPNSWQHFFRKMMLSETPYSSTFEVTNVGLFKVDEEVESLVWGRAAMPIGSAYTVHVIGIKSSKAKEDDEENTVAAAAAQSNESVLSITVTTRQGGTTDGKVFAQRMKKALTMLRHAEAVPEEITVMEMVKLIIA